MIVSIIIIIIIISTILEEIQSGQNLSKMNNNFKKGIQKSIVLLNLRTTTLLLNLHTALRARTTPTVGARTVRVARTTPAARTIPVGLLVAKVTVSWTSL